MENALNTSLSIWIDASAGSGKTTLLVERIVRLLHDKKHNIVCIAFTNNAVEEIRSRIHSKLEILAKSNPDINYALNNLDDLVSICTIHSFCQKILDSYSIEFSSLILNNDIHKRFYKYAINDYLKHDVKVYSKELNIWHLNKIINNIFPNFGYLFSSTDITSAIKLELQQIKEIYTEKELSCKTYDAFREIILNLEEAKGIKEKELLKYLKKNDLSKAFLNNKNQMKNLNAIITKKLREKNQSFFLYLKQWQELYYNFHHKKLFNEIIDQSCNLIDVLYAIYQIYNQYKKNYISYNDIIFKTLLLIYNNPSILCAINKKIDHILIDEAQDNNVAYWEIICKICEDFFSGIGDSSEVRTMFVVGDAKQAIYGFQDSSPKVFHNIKNNIMAKSAKDQWAIIDLNLCYRCSISIIDLVNKIFPNYMHHYGFKDYKNHLCNRKALGKIEILPLCIENSPQNLALMVAGKIYALLDDGLINPYDIAVLVRHKTIFIDLLIKALNALKIQVSNFNAINADEPLIEVLLNIGKTILWDSDEHSLFKLLSSGVLPVNDEEIFLLSYQRETSLYQRLSQIKPDVFNIITKWKEGHKDPFTTYMQILYSNDFIQHLVAFFGKNTMITINSFLELSLLYSSLTEFITDFEENIISCPSIKEANGVVISTVHKAKGMEFPIVILSDSTSIPRDDELIIFTPNKLPLFMQNSNVKKIIELKQQKQDEVYNEYIRLLYVALTRAKDELYICGWHKKPSRGSWYEILQNAIK